MDPNSGSGGPRCKLEIGVEKKLGRLSDQNFPGAVCAFLNAANEWSEVASM